MPGPLGPGPRFPFGLSFRAAAWPYTGSMPPRLLAVLLLAVPAPARASSDAGASADLLEKHRQEVSEAQKVMARLQKDFKLDLVREAEEGEGAPVDRDAAMLRGVAGAAPPEGADERGKAILQRHVDDGASPGAYKTGARRALEKAGGLAVSAVDQEALEAFDPKTGARVRRDDGDFFKELERRIERILQLRVTPAAHRATRAVLWSAAFPCFADGTTGPEPPKQNPVRGSVHPHITVWYETVCAALRDPETPEKDLPAIAWDPDMPEKILGTYRTDDGIIRVGPTFARQADGTHTICHEWAGHQIDHKYIYGGINDNDYSGLHDYGDELAARMGPAYQAATEYYSYKHMFECLRGYRFLTERVAAVRPPKKVEGSDP